MQQPITTSQSAALMQLQAQLQPDAAVAAQQRASASASSASSATSKQSTSDGQPPLPPQSQRAKKKTQAERKAARQAAPAASQSAASSSSTSAPAATSAASASASSSSSSSAARSAAAAAPFLSLDASTITSHTNSPASLEALPRIRAAHAQMDAALRQIYIVMQRWQANPGGAGNQLQNVASAYALLVDAYSELGLSSHGGEFQGKSPQQLVPNLSLYWAAQLSLVVERWWVHAIATLLLDSMSGSDSSLGVQLKPLYDSAAIMPDARRRVALLASMNAVAPVPAIVLNAIRWSEGLLLHFAAQSAKAGAHGKKRPSLNSLPLTHEEEQQLQLAVATLDTIIKTPLPAIAAGSVRRGAILPDRMLAAVDQLTHACMPLLLRSDAPEAVDLRAKFEALSVPSLPNQMLAEGNWPAVQQTLQSLRPKPAPTAAATAVAPKKKTEPAHLTLQQQQQLTAAGQPTGPARRPVLRNPAAPLSSSSDSAAPSSAAASAPAAAAAGSAAPFSFTSDIVDNRAEEQLSLLDLQRLDEFLNAPTAELRPEPDHEEEEETEEYEEPAAQPSSGPASSGLGLAKEVSTRYLQGLSEELERFFDARSLSPRDLADRAQALSTLQSLVTALDPSLKVEVFGSAASRTAMRGSDMDCSLRSTTGKSVAPSQSFWKSLVKSLRSRGAHREIIPILQARVPIVKVVDRASGIQMDLAFGQPSTPHKSALMRSYAEADPRVPALIAAVKYWAKRNNINDGSAGTLNSFGYSLMVIQYLQILRPPILPSLQQQSKDIRAAEAAAGVADHLAPAMPESKLPMATPSPPVAAASDAASSIPSIPLSLLSPAIRMVDPLNHAFRMRSPAEQFWMRPSAETAASIIRSQDDEAFPALGAAPKVRAATPPPARSPPRPASPADPFTLGALFLGFLHFYAHSFDASTMVVNVRAGGLAARHHWVGKTAAKRHAAATAANGEAIPESTAWKTQAEGLAIADPFDPTDNVARSIQVHTWRRIREIMSHSARIMLTQGASFAQVCGDEPVQAAPRGATIGAGAGAGTNIGASTGGRGSRGGRRGLHTEAFQSDAADFAQLQQLQQSPQMMPQQQPLHASQLQVQQPPHMQLLQQQQPPRHVIPPPGLAPPPGQAFAAAAMTHASYAYPPHLQQHPQGQGQQQHPHPQLHQFQQTQQRSLYQPPPLHSSHPHQQQQPQQQHTAAAAGQPEPRPNGNGKFLSFQQQMQQQQQH